MKLLGIAVTVLGGAWFGLAGAQSEAGLATDREALSRPIGGLTTQEMTLFQQGRSLVRQSWVVAPAGDGEVNGLGPLYNRLACISCHAKNGRAVVRQTVHSSACSPCWCACRCLVWVHTAVAHRTPVGFRSVGGH